MNDLILQTHHLSIYRISVMFSICLSTRVLSIRILLDFLLFCTDLVPGDFIHVNGDTHVYRTHVRPLQEQLQKLPKPFPVSIIIITETILS